MSSMDFMISELVPTLITQEKICSASLSLNFIQFPQLPVNQSLKQFWSMQECFCYSMYMGIRLHSCTNMAVLMYCKTTFLRPCLLMFYSWKCIVEVNHLTKCLVAFDIYCIMKCYLLSGFFIFTFIICIQNDKKFAFIWSYKEIQQLENDNRVLLTQGYPPFSAETEIRQSGRPLYVTASRWDIKGKPAQWCTIFLVPLFSSIVAIYWKDYAILETFQLPELGSMELFRNSLDSCVFLRPFSRGVFLHSTNTTYMSLSECLSA